MRTNSTLGALMAIQVGLIALPLWLPSQEPLPLSKLNGQPLPPPPTSFEEWYDRTYFPSSVWDADKDWWRDIPTANNYGLAHFEVTHKGASAVAWESAVLFHALAGGGGNAEVGGWIEDLRTPEGLMTTIDRIQEMSMNGAIDYDAAYRFLKERLPNHMPDMDRDALIEAYQNRPGLSGFIRDRRAWEARPLHEQIKEDY